MVLYMAGSSGSQSGQTQVSGRNAPPANVARSAASPKLAVLLSFTAPMFKRALTAGRWFTLIAVAGSLVGSIALLVYEALVIAEAMIDAVQAASISPKIAKVLAVGLIEALDVFLIAVVAYTIGVGLYVLFIDDTLPVPTWFKVKDLDDLKSHLVSSVIAVLAVLFMREAVAWDGERDLLGFGLALAAVIAVLTLYLAIKSKR